MADTLDRSGPQPTADVETLTDAPPTGEIAVLTTVQEALATDATVRAARRMSLFGEHAGGWLAIGLAGAVLDRSRRREWLGSAAAVAVAHGASIGVKRVVRRRRPEHPSIRVLVGTPSRLSFPSSHATSTTAAAVLYGGLLGRRGWAGTTAASAVVGLMAMSRLVLGVHYPTDVATGAALGAAVACGTRRVIRRTPITRRVSA